MIRRPLLSLSLSLLLLAPGVARAEPPEPATPGAGDAADVLTLLDGTRQSATVASIDADGRVQFTGDLAAMDLDELRRIDRWQTVKPTHEDWQLPIVGAASPAKEDQPDTNPPAPAPGAAPSALARVHLVHDGQIHADSVVIDQSACRLDWAFGKGWSLPLDQVRGLQFKTFDGPEAATLTGPFDRALADDTAEQDRLFVVQNGRLTEVDGVLQALTPMAALFVWRDAVRTISRDKVFGLVLARTGQLPSRLGLCRVATSDGSAMWAKVGALTGGELALRLGQQSFTAPWAQVARMDVQSRRVLFLSDLTPVKVTQESIVTTPLPWRRDRSVAGGPLKVGKLTFEKGLGVHAHNVLLFVVPDGQFAMLAAQIGIDASAQGKGDCVFVVLADDKELYRQRVRGGESPRDVRLNIAGARTVTLAVEPGEDLDLADHGDWCDARFIRTAAPGTSP